MNKVYIVKYQDGLGYHPSTSVEVENVIENIGVKQNGRRRVLINRYELVKNEYELDYIDAEPFMQTLINKFSTNPGNKVWRSYHIFFTKEEADKFYNRMTK